MNSTLPIRKNHRILLIIFVILLLFNSLLLVILFTPFFPAIQVMLNINSQPSEKERQLLKQLVESPVNVQDPFIIEEGGKIAKTSSLVEVGKCSPHPRIISSPEYATITFRNSDTRTHTLVFSSEQTYTLMPGQMKIVRLDFYRAAPGIFPYFCDDSQNPTGAIYLTQNR